MMILVYCVLLGIRLSAAGYHVESAKNAKIALGRLESFHPHLVISDFKDGRNGWYGTI